jgi:putative hydrolase of the HAD superfamily
LKIKHGFRIAAVSNEGRELTEYRVRTFALAQIIDFFICSAFVHFRKPDEEMYQLALDTAVVPPEQVAYIDDRKMFIEVARSMGMHGVHHENLESTRDQLAQFGIQL